MEMYDEDVLFERTGENDTYLFYVASSWAIAMKAVTQ